MKAIFTTSILIILFSCISLAQNSKQIYGAKVDSLIALPDSEEKFKMLTELAFKGKYADYDKTNEAVEHVIERADRNTARSIIANAYKIKGIVADEMGLYEKSISNYLKAIALFKEVPSEMDVAKCEANIGMIFRHQMQNEKALKYFQNALPVFQQERFDYGIYLIYENIGMSYMEMKALDSSLHYYNKAKKVMKKLDIQDGNFYGNVGNVFMGQNQLDSAEVYFLRSIELMENNDVGNKNIAVWYYSYGNILKMKGQYEKAYTYMKKAKDIYGEATYTREAYSLFGSLAFLNYKMGKYKESAQDFKTLLSIKDSLYKIDNTKLTHELAEKYQVEKKELEIENLNKAKKLEEEKRKSEEQKVFYLMIGSVLLGVLVIVAGWGVFTKIRDNKKIKEKNELIQVQKNIVEEKNIEITDSIQYARRIQNGILPPMKSVQKALPNSFILYKPKDIVAGDFYWLEQIGNKTFIAAADCTGHGVPGAMVSVICNNSLNRAVNEFQLRNPGAILDKTREIVVSEFEKGEEEVKDGMDIALCAFEGSHMEYAGANNPLWIIRKGAEEIEEIKPNKFPIGSFETYLPFQSHQLELEAGDTVYIFLDGYIDQFGGDKGKKFKSKNFKNLLLSIQQMDMSQQQEYLNEFFEKWKDDLEQLDDVCVIGIRL